MTVDLTAFRTDYPDWAPQYDLRGILEEIYEHNAERWLADRGRPRASRD